MRKWANDLCAANESIASCRPSLRTSSSSECVRVIWLRPIKFFSNSTSEPNRNSKPRPLSIRRLSFCSCSAACCCRRARFPRCSWVAAVTVALHFHLILMMLEIAITTAPSEYLAQCTVSALVLLAGQWEWLWWREILFHNSVRQSAREWSVDKPPGIHSTGRASVCSGLLFCGPR